jgi:hypothetical protein
MPTPISSAAATAGPSAPIWSRFSHGWPACSTSPLRRHPTAHRPAAGHPARHRLCAQRRRGSRPRPHRRPHEPPVGARLQHRPLPLLNTRPPEPRPGTAAVTILDRRFLREAPSAQDAGWRTEGQGGRPTVCRDQLAVPSCNFAWRRSGISPGPLRFDWRVCMETMSGSGTRSPKADELPRLAR